MTKQEAQNRNWKIMQLIGMLPRVASIIPKDIKHEDEDLVEELDRICKYFLNKIHASKIKKFTCEKCNPVHGIKTENKKAYSCDYCGNWYDDLYTVSNKESV